MKSSLGGIADGLRTSGILVRTLEYLGGGGGHSTINIVLASHPAATGSIPGIPKKFF